MKKHLSFPLNYKRDNRFFINLRFFRTTHQNEASLNLIDTQRSLSF
jgi:hypothetical protein